MMRLNVYYQLDRGDDGLPPRLRQDIEGSGAQPGCIAVARRLIAPSWGP